MRYQFLLDTYETEILKVISAWGSFHDEDLSVRPHPTDKRGRSPREHMVHQCLSEDAWFRNMFGIDVGAPPLPADETRQGFIRRYAEDAGKRLVALRGTDDAWWEAEAGFFKERRSRAWIMVRRIAHTAHHRGQQLALLRMLDRDIHSNYGPTADTGGLNANHASGDLCLLRSAGSVGGWAEGRASPAGLKACQRTARRVHSMISQPEGVLISEAVPAMVGALLRNGQWLRS